MFVFAGKDVAMLQGNAFLQATQSLQTRAKALKKLGESEGTINSVEVEMGQIKNSNSEEAGATLLMDNVDDEWDTLLPNLQVRLVERVQVLGYISEKLSERRAAERAKVVERMRQTSKPATAPLTVGGWGRECSYEHKK